MKIFYITFLMLFVTIISLSCGGNCPQNNCPKCLCSSQMNIVDANQWCSKNDWDQNCCKCIIAHQSAYNSNYLSYKSNQLSWSIGLWNINDQYWPICNSGQPPCDIQKNLQCAKSLYRLGGNTFRYWSSASQCGCI